MREYGYDEFCNDTRELAKMLDGFCAEGIVFVARGGATLAHFLAMGLDIRKMYAVNTHSYEGQKKLKTPVVDRLPLLEGARRVIVADEIVDSGETLQIVMQKLRESYPQTEFRSVALFQKMTASVRADLYVHESDEWVDFFWERDVKI